MDISSHPHWHENAPTSLVELKEYLLRHFDHLCGNPKNINDINKVLIWMKKDSSEILDWEGSDSFFTLFSAFHTGIPFLQEMLKKYSFPDSLVQFLKICTSLEKTTDQFAYAKQWEEIQGKEEIITNLEMFLQHLFTQEEFTNLLEKIHNRND